MLWLVGIVNIIFCFISIKENALKKRKGKFNEQIPKEKDKHFTIQQMETF